MSVSILIGDCRERLTELPDASVDSVVCDPPYHLTSIVKRFGNSAQSHLDVSADKDQSKIKAPQYGRLSRGFMGQTWDGGDVAFQPETWAEVLRVLKPGGHLVAFSGTRTYHRMVVAIEDAGFEVRDQLAWVYGSGFPKSHNQPGGWGTALKPSWEPIALCRKPLIGTVAANIAEHGTGAINIDGCRTPTDEHISNHGHSAESGATKGVYSSFAGIKPHQTDGQKLGRWPANLCHDGSDEVLAGFPETQDGVAVRSRSGGNNIFSDKAKPALEDMGYGGGGSAARFFYCAKATTEERGEGNNHPTVKPVALMRWLCRLVTPPGGTVLDPFMGSGSTGIAADAEQFNFIGIEMSAEYAAIAERRIRDAAGLFAEIKAA